MGDVKFYIATFQKKNMIRKTPFFSHESPMSSSENFQAIEPKRRTLK